MRRAESVSCLFPVMHLAPEKRFVYCEYCVYFDYMLYFVH